MDSLLQWCRKLGNEGAGWCERQDEVSGILQKYIYGGGKECGKKKRRMVKIRDIDLTWPTSSDNEVGSAVV